MVAALREFLYVDTDKVRGLLAQLDGGIVEELHEGTKSQKETTGGVKGLAQHSRIWGDDVTSQKSMGDALFPSLEHALEVEGLLHDVSESLSDAAVWTSGDVQTLAPPGALIRVTAEGSLFDARYVAATFAAFATTLQGVMDVSGSNTAATVSAPIPPKAKTQAQKAADRRRREGPIEPRQLEDALPDVDLTFDQQSSVSNQELRGIVKVSRGLFAPGLHMSLTPTGDWAHAIVARLQEGRQFLDSEPDILFARYGVASQPWTLVGTVGHHGSSAHKSTPDMEFVDDDGNVARARTASLVNAMLGYVGTLGFVDLPQPPGFSVVPLAVYRLIGEPNTHDQGKV